MDSRFRGNDVISARHVTFTLAVAVWPSFPRKRESISVGESRNLRFHESPPTELAFIQVVRGHCAGAGAGGEPRPRQRSGTKGRPMQAGVFTFVRTRLPEISTSAAIVTR